MTDRPTRVRLVRPRMPATDADWSDLANCHGLEGAGTVVFFPNDLRGLPDAGELSAEAQRRLAAAQEVCAGCVVRDDCLAHAIEQEEPCGVWGGVLMEQHWRDHATEHRRARAARARARRRAEVATKPGGG